MTPSWNRTLAWTGALLIALCAGALWSVGALMLARADGWMALPAAVAVGVAARALSPRAAVRAVAAAALFLLAAAYAAWLLASSAIAGAMGFELLDVLVDIGAALATELAWLRLDPIARGCVVAAPILAALVGAWPRRPVRGTAASPAG